MHPAGKCSEDNIIIMAAFRATVRMQATCPIYLADAAVEMLFLAGWVYVSLREKSAAYP